jgi:hypothetical protein
LSEEECAYEHFMMDSAMMHTAKNCVDELHDFFDEPVIEDYGVCCDHLI